MLPVWRASERVQSDVHPRPDYPPRRATWGRSAVAFVSSFKVPTSKVSFFQRHTPKSRKHGMKRLISGSEFQSRLLAFGAAAVILTSVYQQLVKDVVVDGCLVSESPSISECKWVWFNFWRDPSLTKQVFGFSVILFQIAKTLHRTEGFKRRMTDRRKIDPTNLRTAEHPPAAVLSHWTAAASSDVYSDTAAFLVEAQSLVILLIGTTTIIVTAFQGHIAWENASAPRFQSRMLQGCCPAGVQEWDGEQCSNMCRLGFLGKKVPLTFSIGLLSIISCSSMFFPTMLWSPVTLQAIEKSKDVRLWRLLHVQWVALVFGLVNAGLVIAFSISNWEPESMYITEFWEAYWFVSLGLILAELVTIACLAPWETLARIPFDIYHNIEMLLTWRKVSPDNARRYVLFWQCRLSWRYRQLVLLFSGILSFSVDVVRADGTQSPYVWTMRAVIIFLLLVSRDKPADFQTLEMTGAGFGLCVNAKQLRRALVCHLRGKKYTGKVLRYKATLLRMADTLTISYRWNDTAVQLGGGVTINMTEWQMKEMVQAIDRIGCLYVWMDNCALPQDGGELLTRLLSRMMAVYAAGFATLVLLSREYDTDRYHQRVWTLQEYCCASQMIVVEEQQGDASEESEEELDTDREAVVGREALDAEVVKNEYVSAVAHCVPVWLNNDVREAVRGISTEKTMDIQEMYSALSEQRHCRFPQDVVRALYPLLWCLPAESEVELKQLILAIEEVHSLPQTAVLRLFQEYNQSQSFRRAEAKRWSWTEETETGIAGPDVCTVEAFSSDGDTDSEAPLGVASSQASPPDNHAAFALPDPVPGSS